MNQLAATVPISLVNGFLAGADSDMVARLAVQSGVPRELLRQPGARITQEQFSTLYRALAVELDDEVPGIFSRPLRSGTLKFLCLSLLDAPRLEVAMRRFGQFFHLVLDDFRLETCHDGTNCRVELAVSANAPSSRMRGREIMLKLAHGIASWLIGRKIPLSEVVFDFARPERAGDYLYLFPESVLFGSPQTSMSFDASYLDMPIRRTRSDLRRFLSHAPEDWLFVSFADRPVYHRVRQYVADSLPSMPTIELVAHDLHYSVRTLRRRLSSEGMSYQAIKDELRRDIAIQRLLRSSDAIAAIAYDVGFDDPTAFHRAFRHWTGSTPQTYRTTA